MKRTFIFILILTWHFNCASYDIVLERPINFGTVVVVNNDSPGTLSIDRFGNMSASSNFRIIASGEPASFSVTGLPPFSNTSILVTSVDEDMNPGRPYTETFTFSVTSFEPSARADANGDSSFNVGGTITLSGSGDNVYENATYETSFRVTIDL